MKKSLLRSFMVKFGDTQETLANAMGISRSRLNAKINSNGAEFTQAEILFIKQRYDMKPEDVDNVFFAVQVT